MSLTTTEVFGFADAVNEALTENSAELATLGLTVGPWVASGTALKENAVTKNNLQEAAKTALKNATKATEDALKAAYDFYSSKLDSAANAYGKTSDKGKELLKLRSKIRNHPDDSAPPANP